MTTSHPYLWSEKTVRTTSTTLHRHALRACAPAPLAHYLKALGVLRLVAEQADASVRGAWDGEHFVLYSRFSREDLLHFFLCHYQPTPLVSPWNKGSGFYQEKDKGLFPVESSTAPRFEPFRQGIQAARALLEEIALADATVRAIKEEPKALPPTQRDALRDDAEYKRRLAEAERRFKSLKEDELLPGCRLAWRGPHLSWLEAALTLDADGCATFPALLGTGGNDGRLDFTNNQMQRLAELFDLAHPQAPARDGAAGLLDNALFGTLDRHIPAGKAPIGQFLPGGAGGANSTTGPDGGSRFNPWDFVLMLEGTLLFRAQVTRRLVNGASSLASAPFSLRHQATGYAGANASEDSPRGEQWMPLWSQPVTLVELQKLLAEGRTQLGTSPAQRPLEAARAIARLGVARGLTGFQRFGYLERNGQSNLAVPLGRLTVRARPETYLLDELARWQDLLQREARAATAPTRLQLAERSLSDAVLEVLTADAVGPSSWQEVLRCAVDVEALQATGSGIGAGAIPRLSPEWIERCDDGSPTFRLALALGSSAYTELKGQQWLRTASVRQHWLPLEPRSTAYKTSDKRLARSPDVVCFGRDPVEDCLQLVLRALQSNGSRSQRRLTLRAWEGHGNLSARMEDVAQLLSGAVRLEDVVHLARAFMAIDYVRGEWPFRLKSAQEQRIPADDLRPERLPDDAWLALRLALTPFELKGASGPIPADDAIVRRLAAGDATEAVRGALRHLRTAGLSPSLTHAVADAGRARLWGAALAFPMGEGSLKRLTQALCRS